VNSAGDSVISTEAEVFSERRTTRETYPFASTCSEAGEGTLSGSAKENLPSESVVAAAEESPAPSTRTNAPAMGLRAGSSTVPWILEAGSATEAKTGEARSRRIEAHLGSGALEILERRSTHTPTV